MLSDETARWVVVYLSKSSNISVSHGLVKSWDLVVEDRAWIVFMDCDPFEILRSHSLLRAQADFVLARFQYYVPYSRYWKGRDGDILNISIRLTWYIEGMCNKNSSVDIHSRKYLATGILLCKEDGIPCHEPRTGRQNRGSPDLSLSSHLRSFYTSLP
jgi:hypothetical protein